MDYSSLTVAQWLAELPPDDFHLGHAWHLLEAIEHRFTGTVAMCKPHETKLAMNPLVTIPQWIAHLPHEENHPKMIWHYLDDIEKRFGEEGCFMPAYPAYIEAWWLDEHSDNNQRWGTCYIQRS